MRRVLLAVLLLLGLVPVPSGAASPDGLVPYRFPGRYAVGAGTGDAWLQQQYEAIAGVSDISADILERYDAAVTKSKNEYDIYGAYPIEDLDGDRAPDLLYFRSHFTVEEYGLDGSSSITLHSGRNGAARWTRRFSDIPLPGLAVERVGKAGRLGLMVLHAQRRSDGNYTMRFAGLDGRTGKTVYDKRFDSADGKGAVQFGGLLDAVSGGGKEILVGRVRRLLPVDLVLNQTFYETAPFVLDGANGTVRQVHETTIELASGVSFVATGDLDGDSRDEILSIRREIGDTGSIAALSTVENEQLWRTPDLPVGFAVLGSAAANITGTKNEDILLTTWVFRPGLLEIPPLTDGLPLLDGPPDGMHGLLLDGPTGALRWDRLDAEFAFYEPWADVDGDRKTDVLVLGAMHGERDGWRVRLVTGANKVLYTRDLTVAPPPARRGAYAGTYSAGDLDGDRVPDLGYEVVSQSPVEQRRIHGLLLVGSNTKVVTEDFPLGGTLDGGNAERVRVKRGKATTTVTFMDGWRGRAYWSLLLQNSTKVGAWPELQPGARGRCDGIVLHGFDSKGAYWIDVLDGGTGRVRWSKTFVGPRPDAGTEPQVSGRPARCR